jgi:hypothetical protein
MNHKISEIQANAYSLCTKTHEGFIQTDEFTKKFAELIIKECVKVIKETNDRHRREYFANKILEHFGVEE